MSNFPMNTETFKLLGSLLLLVTGLSVLFFSYRGRGDADAKFVPYAVAACLCMVGLLATSIAWIGFADALGSGKPAPEAEVRK